MTTAPPGVLVQVGGSSEIGSAILAELLGATDRSVVLVGRPGPRLYRHADRLSADGHDVDVAPFDANMSAAQTTAVVRALAPARRLDVVVVAVGALTPSSPDADCPEALGEALVVNGVAVAVLVHALAQRLIRQRSGALVVVSSAAAVRPRRAILGYSLGKQLSDAHVRLLVPELRAAGVRTIIVRPGFVETAMTTGLPPAPLRVSPQRVGQDVARALRGRRTVVWVPAAMAVVVRVLGLMPRRLLPPDLR